MANRYANLVGSNKIKDEYQKINIGFDKVEQEMDEKPDNSFARINDVEAEGEDAVTIEAGTGITITTTPEEKKIRITATGEAAPGPHGSEHNHDGADPIPDLVQLKDDFDAHLAKTADDDVHGLAFKGVLFELSASQSIAGGELQKLIWGNKIYEVGINFTAIDGDIIIPPEVSIVRVITNIRWSNSPQFDSGNIDIEAEIRGSSSISRAYDCRRGVRSATINLSSVVRRSDSTQLSVFVRHTATDPISVIKDSRTFLYIEVVQ